MAFEPADPSAEQDSAAAVAAFSKMPDLKRRWLYIIPAVFVTYSLAYVDRANYGLESGCGTG